MEARDCSSMPNMGLTGEVERDIFGRPLVGSLYGVAAMSDWLPRQSMSGPINGAWATRTRQATVGKSVDGYMSQTP